MLLDQFSKPESLVELTHQDQTSVGSDARGLEIDLERSIEGKLKGLGFHPLDIYLPKVLSRIAPA